MKKLLSLAVATFAFAAMAEYTGQTIGVTKITTTNQNTIVAVPFASLTNSLADISANDLVSPVGLPKDTVLQVFKNNQYYGWQLDNNGVWVAVGDQAASQADVIANSTIACGGAIWVVLPSAPATSQDIYIYGDFTTEPKTSSIVGGGESKVANLVANPLQSVASIGVTPAVGDQVIVPQDGAPEVYTWRTKSGGADGTWRRDGKAASLPDIAVGQGIWYVRATNTGDTTISWTAK